MSARSVSDIERGISLAPHRSTLDGLADALHLSGDERDALQSSLRPARGTHGEKDTRVRSPGGADRRSHNRIAHLHEWATGQFARVVTPARQSPAPIRLALSLAMILLSTGIGFKVLKGPDSPGSASAAQPFVPWHVTMHADVAARFPTGFAIDGAGNLFLSTSNIDPRASGVWKFAPSGQVLAHWGRYRRSTIFGNDIDVDQRGNVFVVDAYHDTVLSITPSGKIVRSWGSPGSTPGKFVQADALAVDRRGHVFVGDATGRIQKFSETGKVLAVWSNCGTHQQGYCHPSDMAADVQGNLYVSDIATASVWKLSPRGKTLSEWGTPGSDPSQFYGPGEIAFDRHGDVFVADQVNGRIHQYSPTGRPINWWGSAPGVLSCPSALATTSQGDLFVGAACGRVLKYSPSGVLFATWKLFRTVHVSFDGPSAVSIDAQGRVLVASSNGARPLSRISRGGQLLTSWGSDVLGPGEAHAPTGTTIDSAGNVYVVDAIANRVLKLSPSGKITGSFGREGSGPGQLEMPSAVAVDGTGRVYVTDTGNRRVVVFSPSGASLEIWNTAPNGTALFLQPQGIGVDAQGDVYVADRGKHAIEELSSTGTLRAQWGGPSSMQLLAPVGIAVDHQGSVYVTDVGDSRVKAFSPTGKMVAEWGKKGSGSGEFNQPTALAVDRSGTVYVADTGNDRVQILAPR